MEQKTLEQIIQDVKDALNKAIIELEPIANSLTEDTSDQAGDLRYELGQILSITSMKSPEDYNEYMSSDYYESSC